MIIFETIKILRQDDYYYFSFSQELHTGANQELHTGAKRELHTGAKGSQVKGINGVPMTEIWKMSGGRVLAFARREATTEGDPHHPTRFWTNICHTGRIFGYPAGLASRLLYVDSITMEQQAGYFLKYESCNPMAAFALELITGTITADELNARTVEPGNPNWVKGLPCVQKYPLILDVVPPAVLESTPDKDVEYIRYIVTRTITGLIIVWDVAWMQFQEPQILVSFLLGTMVKPVWDMLRIALLWKQQFPDTQGIKRMVEVKPRLHAGAFPEDIINLGPEELSAIHFDTPPMEQQVSVGRLEHFTWARRPAGVSEEKWLPRTDEEDEAKLLTMFQKVVLTTDYFGLAMSRSQYSGGDHQNDPLSDDGHWQFAKQSVTDLFVKDDPAAFDIDPEWRSYGMRTLLRAQVCQSAWDEFGGYDE